MRPIREELREGLLPELKEALKLNKERELDIGRDKRLLSIEKELRLISSKKDDSPLSGKSSAISSLRSQNKIIESSLGRTNKLLEEILSQTKTGTDLDKSVKGILDESNRREKERDRKGLFDRTTKKIGGVVDSAIGAAGGLLPDLMKTVMAGIIGPGGAIALTELYKMIRGTKTPKTPPIKPKPKSPAPKAKSPSKATKPTTKSTPKATTPTATKAKVPPRTISKAAKDSTKAASSTVAKTVSREASEKASKKAVAKGAARAAGRSAIKKIPIAGALAGIGFGASRLLDGDILGAMGEAASGIVSIVPGFGTAASVAIDSAMLTRDISKELAATETEINSTLKRSSDEVDKSTKNLSGAFGGLETEVKKSTRGMKDFIRGALGLSPTPVSRADENRPTTNRSILSPEPMSNTDLMPKKYDYKAKVDRIRNPMGHTATDYEIGSIAARGESGKAGTMAIGYDRTGGTSYGKYQISSKQGTMNEFLKYLESQGDEGMEISNMLRLGGDSNTGGKSGGFVDQWKKVAKDYDLGKYEHGFIKKTHYDKAYRGITDENLKEMIDNNPALQELLWSTSVQHGGTGGSRIFNRSHKEGMSVEDLVSSVFDRRSTQFGSSTDGVRKSVLKRFEREEKDILAMLSDNKITNHTKEPLSAKDDKVLAPNTSFLGRDPTSALQPIIIPSGQSQSPSPTKIIRANLQIDDLSLMALGTQIAG